MEKRRYFSKIWLMHHHDDVINSKLVFLTNFGKYQLAGQIRFFRDFLFKSYVGGVFASYLRLKCIDQTIASVK